MDSYRSEVEQAYLGEVCGEQLFAAMAAKCADPEHRHKILALQQLEKETKERLRPLATALGCSMLEDDASRERAVTDASTLSARPWLDQMRLFKKQVPKYVAGFERLQGAGRPEDAAILAHVTAHERAILSFAERELAGQHENSLEPIIVLLQSVPAR